MKRLKWHIFIPNASAAFLIENMKNKNIIVSNSYMIITAADRGNSFQSKQKFLTFLEENRDNQNCIKKKTFT